MSESAGQPPCWEEFKVRLGLLSDPHSVRGAQLEYLQALFPCAGVEYTPPGLAPIASSPRLYASVAAMCLEGLPFPGESAILDDMVLISGRRDSLGPSDLAWVEQTRTLTLAHLARTQALPPEPFEHPVTKLGQEPLFHQCVQSLSGERQIVFHGLFLSIDGFARRFGARLEGEPFLHALVALLRDTHPPRTALFHLSHAFFAVLTTGPTRRQYRKSTWNLRNLMLRRAFLPDRSLNISVGVISWPSDACFPGPFCDLLLSSLNRARKKGGHSVIFTEDWYRNPFAR